MHTDETASRSWVRRFLFGSASVVVFVGITLRAFCDPVPLAKLRLLRNGMSQDEARSILGDPTRIYPGQWTYKRVLVFGFVNLHWLPDGTFDGEVNYERF